MPTSKKPKRKYKPAPYRLPSTIRYSESQETQLQLIPHIALDLFRTGRATEGDWHTLACRISWGSVLATWHHPEVVDVSQAGAIAMHSAFERHSRTQKWGFSGEELRAVGDALNLVDDMQKAHTRRELVEALKYTLRVAGKPDTVGALVEVDQ